MCGIAGILQFDGSAVSPDAVNAMVASLEHRGPDDKGVFIEGGVGFGMTRLSIIDLSKHGHQPMVSESRDVVVIFNGEIYNFADLRSLLLAEGHHFQGRSDTEVLLHGYAQFGPLKLASLLEGMFAFAILDRKRRRLFLGRDAFGVKPLYLRRGHGYFSFGSEIRALAAAGKGNPSIDPAFVTSFLRLGYVPSPHTAFRDVQKLAPGTLLEVDLATGEERAHRFYELKPALLEDTGDGPLLDRLRTALNLAVRRQLVADVPVGVFLSGGLDSSTLSALSARYTVDRVRTFTIGFAGSDRGDETAQAADVARRIGSQNTAIELAPQTLHDLEAIVSSLEEPLADSAVLPLWHLCKGTRAHVKVALSGEGGDEALGGYARYFWGPVAARFSGSPLPLLEGMRRATAALPARSSGLFNLVRRVGKFADSAHLPEAQRYLAWFDLFSAAEREQLHPENGEDRVGPRVNALFARAAELGLGEVQRLQYVDFHTMLLDNLLMKSDKLSMAHSLEVRVPMLDRPLVELGLALPDRAKIGASGGKVLLRRFVRAELKGKVSRLPKRGFEIPVDAWFREEATRDLRATLQRGALVTGLGFSEKAIADLVARHLSGEDLGRKLFALLTLELWAHRHRA